MNPYNSLAGLKKQTRLLQAIVDTLEQVCATESPDGVAKTIAKAKVKGKMAIHESCPLALYVRRNVPNLRTAEVSGDTLCVETTIPDIAVISVDLPTVARRFVRNFDNGRYPEITEGGQKAIDKVLKLVETEAAEDAKKQLAAQRARLKSYRDVVANQEKIVADLERQSAETAGEVEKPKKSEKPKAKKPAHK